MTVRGIVWFRRDLRVHDHPALSAALAECDEVIPLFVFDQPLLDSKQFGGGCVTFMLACLQDLATSLMERGLRLRWRLGDPKEEVLRVAHDLKVDAVYWNRDYEPAARDRDKAVEQALRSRNMATRSFKDHVVFEAGEILSASGTPLQRYSAYRARWWTAWRMSPPPVLPPPARSRKKAHGERTPIELPTPRDLGYSPVSLAIKGGEQEGRRRLTWFLRGPIQGYATGRNMPAVDGTSMLSPHFRFGTLSSRSAVHAALAATARQGHSWKAGVQTWIDELVWRDFFQQVLAHFPHVADGLFRQDKTVPKHRSSTAAYTAWCEGRTGFPLVDAGMRQLNQTGWMHNRVRMVVASFLVKDLRLDWRLGERYFMEHLLDADLAANNGNWQWCASTGTDAMPGYRIFNPALQAKKFDPDGTYIRRYVPELAGLPTKLIHEPGRMTLEEQTRWSCRLGQNYPRPIVDHRQARQDYLNRTP